MKSTSRQILRLLIFGIVTFTVSSGCTYSSINQKIEGSYVPQSIPEKEPAPAPIKEKIEVRHETPPPESKDVPIEKPTEPKFKGKYDKRRLRLDVKKLGWKLKKALTRQIGREKSCTFRHEEVCVFKRKSIRAGFSGRKDPTLGKIQWLEIPLYKGTQRQILKAIGLSGLKKVTPLSGIAEWRNIDKKIGLVRITNTTDGKHVWIEFGNRKHDLYM